ncbi:Uncharacterised protein [Serratia ficaria]|uniref:hypothetical protein n=1 Tax=Serratia ficaria TaxID=61651 RepID=UPI002182EA21|nr:hypothetical protein [Serratia ficaria]CAI2535149.1 Uncharacterised protein [Serratia ficaria]CAI2535882.1 Uncharacterised protein [Serratia ficaria]
MEPFEFDENKNAWLLTLPEIRINGHTFATCTVVAVRTLKDSWYPEGNNFSEPKELTERECTLSLYWNGGGWGKEQEFVARYKPSIWERPPELDLTNSDFILEYELRGRGLGSWIMQQFICWARTLPADTPVKSITISHVDEDERDNITRRDCLWHGIGFRFKEGNRRSLPLCIGELQVPKGRHSTLSAVLLHKGVGELIRDCEEQKRKIRYLETTREHQATQIRVLTERQWDVLLIKGFFAVILSPIWVPGWLYTKLSRRKAGEHSS